MLAGQSNMCGRGRTKPGDERERNIFALDVECNWDEASGGVYTYENFPDHSIFDFKDKIGLGPGLRFAECVRKAGCDRNIGLVPTAVGGTSLKEWHPEKGKCYKKAIARALEAKKHGTLRALLWHQGESDANEKDFATYGEKLKAVFAGFRRDLQEPNLIILVGTLGEWLEQHFAAKSMFSRWREVNEQIREVASSTTDTYLVESKDLSHAGDNLHYSAEGAQRLGERFCSVYLRIMGKLEEPFKTHVQVVDPERAIVSNQGACTAVNIEVRAILRKHNARITVCESIIAEIEDKMKGFSLKRNQMLANALQM